MYYKKKPVDSVQAFLDQTLQAGGYESYRCFKHGKVLVKPDTDKVCPVCGRRVYEEGESLREARVRRVRLLRNHLEE